MASVGEAMYTTQETNTRRCRVQQDDAAWNEDKVTCWTSMSHNIDAVTLKRPIFTAVISLKRVPKKLLVLNIYYATS